jgi:hypothetical protein
MALARSAIAWSWWHRCRYIRVTCPALKTRCAAAKARSTSADLQWARLAKTCPVAGLMVSNLSPSSESQYLPSIKACPLGVSPAAMALSQKVSSRYRQSALQPIFSQPSETRFVRRKTRDLPGRLVCQIVQKSSQG